MTLGSPGRAQAEVEARRQFVSDVFHAVSQPLTALRCSLELALMGEATAERYAAALREGLTHAERVTYCAEFLRAMAEADDPGSPSDVDLPARIVEACSEFAPVLEYQGKTLSVAPGPSVRLHVDGEKLARAMFYLLDSIALAPTHVTVAVRHSPVRIEIAIVDRTAVRSERADQSFAVAERTFRALGAEVTAQFDGTTETLTIMWAGAAVS